MENNEVKVGPVWGQVEQEMDEFNKRLDTTKIEFDKRLAPIEGKIREMHGLNGKLLDMVGDMLIFLRNLEGMDNWFYSSVREKIITEEQEKTQKFFELLEQHQTVMGGMNQAIGNRLKE